MLKCSVSPAGLVQWQGETTPEAIHDKGGLCTYLQFEEGKTYHST